MLVPDDWDVDYTPEFTCWWRHLSEEQREAVAMVVVALQGEAAWKRPYFAPIVTSQRGLWELRATADGHLRVLFALDPRGRPVLLWGGDKSGRWNDWYDEFVPRADGLYDRHLARLRAEGVIE